MAEGVGVGEGVIEGIDVTPMISFVAVGNIDGLEAEDTEGETVEDVDGECEEDEKWLSPLVEVKKEVLLAVLAGLRERLRIAVAVGLKVDNPYA